MQLIKFIFSKTFLKNLVIAVIFLVIILFLLLFWLKQTTNHNEHIEVPSLAKMSLDEAQQKLKESGLRMDILDSANFNPSYPPYSVIEQIPASGKKVKENRKIYITLNPSGYRKIEIPPLVGKTKRQVESTLVSLGFKVGKTTYRPHIAKDEVLDLKYKGKSIQAQQALQVTAVIDLVLGDGKKRYQDSANQSEETQNQGE